jgi:hypothetical protein
MVPANFHEGRRARLAVRRPCVAIHFPGAGRFHYDFLGAWLVIHRFLCLNQRKPMTLGMTGPMWGRST